MFDAQIKQKNKSLPNKKIIRLFVPLKKKYLKYIKKKKITNYHSMISLDLVIQVEPKDQAQEFDIVTSNLYYQEKVILLYCFDYCFDYCFEVKKGMPLDEEGLNR